MSEIKLTNVTVKNNPATFLDPIQFEISFEAMCGLKEDLDWSIVYVGSSEDNSRDQVLEEVAVGPVNEGPSKFILEADAPDPQKIKRDDLLGVTVILLTGSYVDQDFVRVGYYVNNTYELDQSEIQEVEMSDTEGEEAKVVDTTQQKTTTTSSKELPADVDFSKITRKIMDDQPRVTKFYDVDWDKQYSDSEGEDEDDQDENVNYKANIAKQTEDYDDDEDEQD